MKKSTTDQISLTIHNNMNLPGKISLMGNLSTPGANQINAKKQYFYDMTGQTFAGITQVVLQVKPNAFMPFEIHRRQLQQGTFEAVANALTSMGFGFFLSSSATIYTYNSQLIFGDISLE